MTDLQVGILQLFVEAHYRRNRQPRAHRRIVLFRPPEFGAGARCPRCREPVEFRIGVPGAMHRTGGRGCKGAFPMLERRR